MTSDVLHSPRSLPARIPAWLHDRVAEASWNRPALDRLAGLGQGPRALLDRVEPLLAAPTRPRTVSVIIPCYNYGRFLADAVGSALGQADARVEVIVVNDASTDDTAEVAEAIAATDPRVTVVHNTINLGHVRTFNRGYELASGEFVVRLDADDLLTPGSLARALAVFEVRPGVGLVYGHPRHFDSAAPPAPRVGHVRWSVWSGHDWVAERCRRGVNCITTPEAVVRTSAMKRVGPLNTALRFAQDMEMWLRVAAVSDVARVHDADQAWHRDHPGSMSENEGSGLMTDLHERRRVFVELFGAVGEELPDRDALGLSWRRALAREALYHARQLQDRGRTDPAITDQLRTFSLDTWPDRGLTEEWRELDRRGKGSPASSALALARVARSRIEDEFLYLRWCRTGL